jgi:hypothetical protein
VGSTWLKSTRGRSVDNPWRSWVVDHFIHHIRHVQKWILIYIRYDSNTLPLCYTHHMTTKVVSHCHMYFFLLSFAQILDELYSFLYPQSQASQDFYNDNFLKKVCIKMAYASICNSWVWSLGVMPVGKLFLIGTMM